MDGFGLTSRPSLGRRGPRESVYPKIALGSSPRARDESRDAPCVLIKLIAKRFAQQPLLSADANTVANQKEHDSSEPIPPARIREARRENQTKHSEINRIAHNPVRALSDELVSFGDGRRVSPLLTE